MTSTSKPNAAAAFTRIAAHILDLGEAKEYVEYLLAARAGSLSAPDKVVLRALSAAFCIAYGRPFSGSYGHELMAGGRANKVLCRLSPEERHLHDHLINLRNKAFAHSDGEALQPTLENDPRSACPIPWMEDARKAFSEDELRAYGKIIAKLLAALEDEFRELGAVVRAEAEQQHASDGDVRRI